MSALIPHSPSPVAADWTDDELRAAVSAYLEMLQSELLGLPYVKSAVNQALRNGPLASRTKASIEFRMQNISATLYDLRLPHIGGYLPAKNVGTGVKDRIKDMLVTLDIESLYAYRPTVDTSLLDERVAQLRTRTIGAPPRGNKRPPQQDVTIRGFVRDPAVKRWVLDNANGICEGCGEPAPFTCDTGMPYLEVHHITMLAAGGSDRITNAIALCPNCHRRCHYSVDRDDFKLSLFERVGRLQIEVPMHNDEPNLVAHLAE